MHASQVEQGRETSVGWVQRLADLLVVGTPVADAVSELKELGVPEAAAQAAAAQLRQHPLYDIARTYWTRLQCREWLFAVHADLAELRGDVGQIDRVTDISAETFVRDYYLQNRALMLPDSARSWPAVSKWGRQYFIDQLGSLVVSVMVGRDSVSEAHQSTATHLRQEMPFADYARLVYDSGPGNNHYLVSRNRFFDQPETRMLLQDLGDLPFVNMHSSSDQLSLWFGPGGTHTGLHYDAKNNVMVQILGSKRVQLLQPCFSEYMAQSQRWYAAIDPSSLPADSFDGIAPTPIEVVLEPGDALFIPAGWWHAVDSREVSATVASTDFGVRNAYPNR